MSANRMRFGVVGMNHGHIYGMVDTVVRAGGELVSFHASEPELAAEFARQYPTATWSHDERAVLEDPSLQLVLSSITPSERASLGIRVMQHGKDYLVDKPGVTTLDQLAEVRRVQTATKRIYSIMYSERLENGATIRAGDLVRDGAIGAVVQTIGLGPHRVHNDTRHRRLHRSAEERRPRWPRGRESPLPRGREGRALRRLRRGGTVVRPPARGRRDASYGDSHDAGALLPGRGAGAHGSVTRAYHRVAQCTSAASA